MTFPGIYGILPCGPVQIGHIYEKKKNAFMTPSALKQKLNCGVDNKSLSFFRRRKCIDCGKQTQLFNRGWLKRFARSAGLSTIFVSAWMHVCYLNTNKYWYDKVSLIEMQVASIDVIDGSKVSLWVTQERWT